MYTVLSLNKTGDINMNFISNVIIVAVAAPLILLTSASFFLLLDIVLMGGN